MVTREHDRLRARPHAKFVKQVRRVVPHGLFADLQLCCNFGVTHAIGDQLLAIATTVYIVLAIQFEEHDLVSEHGAKYEEYRRTVPMLLPGRARTSAAAPLTPEA